MPRTARRAMRGATVNRAVELQRKARKEQLKQMLSRQRRDSLEAIFEGDSGADKEGVPQVFREKLKAAERAWIALEDLKANEGRDKDRTTICLTSLHDECRMKYDRSRRASRGGTFLIFFAFYAAVLVMQRNAFRGEQVGRSIINYFVQTKYPAPTTGTRWPDQFTTVCQDTGLSTPIPSRADCQVPISEMKGFLDVVTKGDLWDWLEQLFIKGFYKTMWENGDPRGPEQINKWDLRNRPIQGFRFMQRRMEPGAVTRHSVDGGCWAYNDGRMRAFAPECYDHMGYCADGSCILMWEDKRPFGTFNEPDKYTYESFKTGYSASYPREYGFWKMFPVTDVETAQQYLRELKQDMWIDKATQWFRIDFTVMNPEERLFVTMQFFWEFDYSGLVIPHVISDVYQVEWYNWGNQLDVLRFILEIIVVLSWVLQVGYLIHDFIGFRKEHPEMGLREAYNRFTQQESYSVLRTIQLFLFIIVFGMWGFIVFDPFNGKIRVFPNEMDWDGEPLFLQQMAGYIRSYFILNGVITFLFILRIIQLAKVNPKFSLLSESLDNMKYRLMNFAIVLFTLLLFFTLMGMMLFGDKVPEFSDLGAAFVSTTQILIGGGGDPDDVGRTMGGGAGVQNGVDYPELAAVAPRTAWLWYYPFVIIMIFVVINITIAIIGEAHHRVKQSRDPSSDTFVLSPSEGWRGQPTSVWHQMKRGVFYRIKHAVQGMPPDSMTKHQIQKYCEGLPGPSHIDWDVISIKDLISMSRPLGVTRENLYWMMDRYPFICNTSEDLEHYLEERTPPSMGTKKNLEALGASIEDLINMQAIIHAKFDLLVRMATV